MISGISPGNDEFHACATYDNVLAGSATLAAIGIVPAGIATSSFRITWLVPDDRLKQAVRALHERYIEQQRPLVP